MGINKLQDHSNKVIAFSHIPKAAGSTITHILRSKFGINHCRAISQNEFYTKRDFEFDNKIYSNIKSISGHQLRPFVDFGEYENNIFWFIMLREPIERFISQYRWWKFQNKSKIDFEEWCKVKGEKFANFQVRWIAGDENIERAIDLLNNKIHCVGSQEYFNESLKHLRVISNNKLIPTEIKRIVNPAKKSVSSINLELCKKYNTLDLALYKFFIDEILPKQKEKAVSEINDPFQPTLGNMYRKSSNMIYHKLIYSGLKKFILIK